VKKWNQGWARPSRSNCSDHSAGASRKVATPMPRGSRPSTAALTRAGAMNAIDIVMLTQRTLHFWRAAMASMLAVPETISSSQARPRAIGIHRAGAVEGRLPRGIGVANLRDAPDEWSLQFERLGQAQP